MKTRNIREQKASKVFSMLKKKYEVEFCPFDPTAIIIFRITKKQFDTLCRNSSGSTKTKFPPPNMGGGAELLDRKRHP